MQLRVLKTIEEFKQVVALEREVWGYTDEQDVVPVPIFIITVKRGGLLIGAFDGDRLAGFAYSIPGFRDGKPIQWSHMTGVAERDRNRGLGRRLKIEQRRLTLEMGIDLVEWTYDPLQAQNANLNFVYLGVVVEEYEEDVYGESSSVLHRGTATDRFIARWWLRDSGVERRLTDGAQSAMHEIDIAEAVDVNTVRRRALWYEPTAGDLTLSAPRLLVTIPMGFSEMQRHDLELARVWRASTREIFTHYFARGYRVVDFFLDRPQERGAYLLTR